MPSAWSHGSFWKALREGPQWVHNKQAILRGSLAAKQRVGEEPRGHLEMLEGSVTIQTRAVSGLGTQVCGPGRCQDGLEMRDEEEGGVRCDSDKETRGTERFGNGPTVSQPGSEASGPAFVRGSRLACWRQAAPYRDARGAEGEGSGAASSRFVHGLCSVPGMMEIDQGICQGMGVHSVLPAAHLAGIGV